MPHVTLTAKALQLPALLAALAVNMLAMAPAQAFNPQPDPPGRWAVLGLVSDQTLRLSVLAVPVDRNVPPDPCRVTVNFLDAAGTQLIEATTFVVLPGKMQFVDLKGTDLRLFSRTERMQLRSDVHVLHNPPAFRQCNGVAVSVEVFDGSGRNSLTLPASFIPPDPY